MSVFHDLVEEADRVGRQRFSRWRPALLKQLAEGPALTLWAQLGRSEEREVRFRAYLDLALEAIGRGVLTSSRIVSPTAGGVLPTLLVRQIPREAPSVRRMVELWNVGDGLAAHSPWLDRLVAPACDELDTLADLEATLAAVLERLYQAPTPSNAADALRTEVVHLRRHAETFLPGRLRFVTPRILAVRDRRNDDELAIAVLPERTWIAGPLELPIESSAPSEVPVALGPGSVRIGEARGRFEGLTTWQHVVVSPAGFVAATCVDSQRLWIGRP
ncbi:MAG: hypothetical protein AAGE52_33040 [Myxococcota bacterium]